MSLSLKTIDIKTLNCWNEIGISGDRSCPELRECIHCRNCPVFADAARGFFDRKAPEGYLQEWSDQLDKPLIPANRETLSLLVFRLGGEWFGVRSQIVVEVTTPRPLHSIPHRKSSILRGMVNLRGQLQLQVSFKDLLGVAPTDGLREERSDRRGNVGAVPRLIVLKRGNETWVFLADEVFEVRRFSTEEVRGVPSTLANKARSFSRAVLLGENRTIGYLDDDRLFAALRDIQG